jgi:NitT/TauT family transport system substrate-binding protein
MIPNVSRGRFLGAGASALGLAVVGVPTWGADLMPLHAASSSNDEVTPFLYAMDTGAFRRAGIDAQIDRLASGSAIVAGVVGGQYDVGKSSLPSLLAARSKGIGLTLLAPGGEYNAAKPSFGLVVRADAPFKTGADLNGKTAAVSAIDDLYTMAMRTWIDSTGGDSSTVKLVEVPMSTVGGALQAGRLDVGTLTEPFLTDAVTTGKLRLLAHAANAIGPHFTMTAWFAKDDFAQRQPALAAAFVKTLHDAAVYTNAHHDETAPMLAKFLSVPTENVTSMGVRVTAGTSLTPQLLKPLIDAAARYKVIPSASDPRELISTVAYR